MGFSIRCLSVMDARGQLDILCRCRNPAKQHARLLAALVPCTNGSRPHVFPHSFLLAISDPPSTLLHNTGFLTGEALWQPSARNNGHPCPPSVGDWVATLRVSEHFVPPQDEQKNSNEPCASAPPPPPPAACRTRAIGLPRPLHKDSRPIGGPASVFTWKPGPLPAH